MSRKIWMAFSFLSVFVFIVSLLGPVSTTAASGAQLMPANPEKILNALVKQGRISASATPEQKEAALQVYLQQKTKGMKPEGNPTAKRSLADETANLSSGDIRGRKLGTSTTVASSTPQFQPVEKSGKLLMILVEFGDDAQDLGPTHNQISKPANSYDLWIPDFSREHYVDMMFTKGGWTIPGGTYAGQQRGSMRDYYLEQSYGKYDISGDAYGWYKVDHSEAYYGDDDPEGGNDNLLPGVPSNLIADAIAAANVDGNIPWAEYDTNDDCVIDHPLFIHAGMDQSGGGGAQGDNAIWAHSSSVNHLPVSGPVGNCADGLFLDNYTIMPEDGGVGVFAHEFGHDLGLPDEYDTAYSGRGDSVAFWSLMSSGSWVGQPAQTQPSNMSIWAKYQLGWLVKDENLAVVDLENLTKTPVGYRLEQAERWGGEKTINSVLVNLPLKYFYTNTPYSGTGEWFGGKYDEADTKLTRTVDLTGKTSANLSFWTWYDIEEEWDYGFVQVSTDGTNWASLPIAGTRSDLDAGGMPSIKANLPGFTGNSGGWLQKTFDLSAYAGQPIQLRFRYMTDWGTTMAGFFVDDISVTADGATLFADNVETLDSAWAIDGWSQVKGFDYKEHYYMLEWRNFAEMKTPYDQTTLVNFDAGLKKVYQHDPYLSTGNPDEPWWFSYNPGLLVWYRDTAYDDNWTGTHPGAGFLLVVDAHPNALLRSPYLNYGSLPWNSRVQTYDSTFSLLKGSKVTIGYWGKVQTLNPLAPQPNFTDSQSYWSSKAPANSVITPKYGVNFRVVGQAKDGSAALIGIGK